MSTGSLARLTKSALVSRQRRLSFSMPPNAHTVPGYSQKSVSHFSSLSDNTMSNEKDVEMRKMFEEWMSEYGRAYSNPKEKEMRFKIFEETVRAVNAHNKVEGRMYDQCVNQFADLTDKEFTNTCCGFGFGYGDKRR